MTHIEIAKSRLLDLSKAASTSTGRSLNQLQEIYSHPYYGTGKVIHGYGRGSRELGVPTANLSQEAMKQLESLKLGIHFGYAWVDDEPAFAMVMSLGMNPFYGNKQLSCEVHLLDREDTSEFYGSTMRIVVLGYLRPEQNYPSLESLVEDICADMEIARRTLRNIPIPEQLDVVDIQQ